MANLVNIVYVVSYQVKLSRGWIDNVAVYYTIVDADKAKESMDSLAHMYRKVKVLPSAVI